MNANECDYPVVIANRMKQWFDVHNRGVNQSDRDKAWRNLRRLIRKYPEIAKRLGFEVLWGKFYRIPASVYVPTRMKVKA